MIKKAIETLEGSHSCKRQENLQQSYMIFNDMDADLQIKLKKNMSVLEEDMDKRSFKQRKYSHSYNT